MKQIAINAHLLASSQSYRQAGIHRYIYNSLTHLSTLDDEMRYLLFLNHSLDQKLPHCEEKISALNTESPFKRILWEQFIQPFALRKVKPDLYHGMAFVIPYALPCPSVVTVYDLSFERYPEILSTLRRHYLQRFTRSSCQRATRIIAISASTAEDMVQLWGIDRAKIDIAPPAVSPEFRPLDVEKIAKFRQEAKLPARFLLFLGTLEPRKNLAMLIRAYAQLPKSLRDEVHLVLGGGKGWMYEDIFATITEYDLENHVHLPGYIAPQDLVLWYNAAEAFVYPALYEGFGIPILEALACGKPVLAANTSSLPEAAGDIGLLLPPDDERAWTAALQAVLESPEKYKLLEKDAIAWAGRFTWQATAQKIRETYNRVLS